jgi:transposase
MKNKEIVSINVSKNVLDVFILSAQFHFTVPNTPEGFAQLLEIVSSKLKDAFARVFFCFENTGRYSKLLSVFLLDGV